MNSYPSQRENERRVGAALDSSRIAVTILFFYALAGSFFLTMCCCRRSGQQSWAGIATQTGLSLRAISLVGRASSNVARVTGHQGRVSLKAEVVQEERERR